MATQNIVIGTDWMIVAAATDTGFLISSTDAAHYIEYATTDAQTAPDATLRGHAFKQVVPVGRGLLGPGWVWARLMPPDSQSVLAVTRS